MAWKPARSVGCGSLGSSAVGILNSASVALAPWQVWQVTFLYFLGSNSAKSFLAAGSTVLFMYFFLSALLILSQSIFFAPAASAGLAASAGFGAAAGSAARAPVCSRKARPRTMTDVVFIALL